MLKHALSALAALTALTACSNDAAMGGGGNAVKKTPDGKPPVPTLPATRPVATVPVNAVIDDAHRKGVPVFIDEGNGTPPANVTVVDPLTGPPPPPDYAGKSQLLKIDAIDHSTAKPVDVVLMADTSNSMKNHLEKLKQSLHAIPDKLTAQGVSFQLHLLSMQDLVYDAKAADFASPRPANVTGIPADIGVFKSGDDPAALAAIIGKIKINDAAITDKDKAIAYYNQPGLCAVGRYMLANDALKQHHVHVMVLTDEDDPATIEVANPADSEQKRQNLLNCFPQPPPPAGGSKRDVYTCTHSSDSCVDKELAPAQPLKRLGMTKYCTRAHFLCTDDQTDVVTFTCNAPDTYSGCKVYVDGQPTAQTETISFASFVQRRANNRVEGCTPSATTHPLTLGDDSGLTGCTRNVTHPSAYPTQAERDAAPTRYSACQTGYDDYSFPYEVVLNAKNQLVEVKAKACPAAYAPKTVDISVGSTFAAGLCASELDGKTLPDGLTAIQNAPTSASSYDRGEYSTTAAEKAALDARAECHFVRTEDVAPATGGYGANGNFDPKVMPTPQNTQQALTEFNLTWHAIVAKDAQRCAGETTGDISRGNAYYQLVGQTQGTVSDVCDPNYDTAVAAMTEKIVQQSLVDAYTLDGSASAIKTVTNQRTGAVLASPAQYSADGHAIVFKEGVQIGDTVRIDYQ